MRLAGDHDRHALPLMGFREADFDLHFEIFSQPRQSIANRGAIQVPIVPGSLNRHAELTSSDLLFQRFNVGALLEQKTRDAGDHARFVPPDYRDRGKLFHGSRSE